MSDQVSPMQDQPFPPVERPAGQPLVDAGVVDGGVGLLRLTDGAHRNALRIELSLDLEAAVHELLAADVGALVLTAEAPVFCAGGDLDDLIAPRASLTDVNRGIVALLESPVVTVAAVDGPAIGAGVNLPLACDVVLASPRARFDPRLLDLGIHPGGGMLWQLVQRIGRQGAAALVLCGDVLDGGEAAAAGLAWRCLPSEELEEAALRLARRASGRPRDVVARARQTLDASLGLATAAEARALEHEAQTWSMASPELPGRVQALKDRLAERRR